MAMCLRGALAAAASSHDRRSWPATASAQAAPTARAPPRIAPKANTFSMGGSWLLGKRRCDGVGIEIVFTFGVWAEGPPRSGAAGAPSQRAPAGDARSERCQNDTQKPGSERGSAGPGRPSVSTWVLQAPSEGDQLVKYNDDLCSRWLWDAP